MFILPNFTLKYIYIPLILSTDNSVSDGKKNCIDRNKIYIQTNLETIDQTVANLHVRIIFSTSPDEWSYLYLNPVKPTIVHNSTRLTLNGTS